MHRGNPAGIRICMMLCRLCTALRLNTGRYRIHSRLPHRFCRCNQVGTNTETYWCRRGMWHYSCMDHISIHRCWCHNDRRRNPADRNSCSYPRCWRKCRYCIENCHVNHIHSHQDHSIYLKIEFNFVFHSNIVKRKYILEKFIFLYYIWIVFNPKM